TRLLAVNTFPINPQAHWGSADNGVSYSAAWGDMDNDGDLDLAIGNRPGANVIYENVNGVLSAAPTWTSDQNDDTYDLAWADLNGDGYLDLYAGNDFTDFYYLNQNGTLPTAPSWTGYALTSETVAIADYDADGDLDVVVGNSFSGNAGLFENNGSGLSTTHTTLPESGIVAWVDIENDGDLDLAFAGIGVQIYLNVNGVFQPNAAMETATNIGTIRSMAWADVDNDGDLDVAVSGTKAAETKEYVFLYLNNNGTLESTIHFESIDVATTHYLEWGDVDGDGDPDLAAASWFGPERVYRNDAGQLSLQWQSNNTNETYGLALGDVDGDGDLDLATANADVRTLLFRNEGLALSAELTWRSNSTTNAFNIAWQDIDNDSDLDLVVQQNIEPSNPTGVPVAYENLGGSLASEPTLSPNVVFQHDTALGDVDGDGDLDLAQINALDRNEVYLNEGDGTYRVMPLWAADETTRSSAVAWADVNGDGMLDLAFANQNSPNFVYLNVGGTLATSASWASNDSDWSQDLEFADVDGDGDLDLAVANGTPLVPNATTPPNRVYLNDGGMLLPDAVWNSSETHESTAVSWGDVNGDGLPDLAFSNESLAATVYLNKRIGTTRQPDQTASIEVGSNLFNTTSTFDGGTLPIDVTLSQPDGLPVSGVRGWYSADGGDHWLPALSASGTSTTNLATRYSAESSTPIAIPDAGSVSSVLNFNRAGETAQDLQIGLALTHGVSADLQIAVASAWPAPTGTHALIFDGQAGNGLHNVRLGDQATRLLAGKVNTNGYAIYPSAAPVNISANTTVSSPLVIANGIIDIRDINLTLTVTHGSVKDLTLQLVDPYGNTQYLIGDLCSPDVHQDMKLTFDDEASDVYNTIPCPPTDWGSYQPWGRLSTFDRLDANGVWTLRVTNDGAVAGTIDSWALNMTGKMAVSNSAETLSGFYQPHTTLSQFDGMPLDQPLTLIITDTVGGNTGTLTSWSAHSAVTHSYVWDVYNSGFLGQSDNVVLRLEALPSTVPSADVPPTHQLPSVAAATLPLSVRGTQVRVVNGDAEPVELANGLIGHWQFEEGSGTSTADGSGAGNHGTLVGNAAWSTTVSALGRTGSIDINGSWGYVQLQNDGFPNTADFTFAGWVYWRGGSAEQHIFDFGPWDGKNMHLTPSNGSGVLEFSINDGTGPAQTLNATYPLPTNEWAHVAVTLDGDAGALWLNGQLVHLQPITFDPADVYVSNGWTWFGHPQTGAPALNAIVDEFRIYDRALNQTEISVLNGKVASSSAEKALIYRMPAGNDNAQALASNLGTPLTTDANGYLEGRGQINVGDTLFALYPIFTTAPDKLDVSSSDLPKTIAAGSINTVSSTIEVTENRLIQDVDVIDLVGTHLRVSNLVMRLRSPAGTEIELMNRPCAFHADFAVNLDDEASALKSYICPIIGDETYRPTEALSAFDGETTAGTWTLIVEDVIVGHGGTLDGWGLSFTVENSSKYSLYHASGIPNPLGVSGTVVTQLGLQTLTVTKKTPLLLFDLDLSLEWDARNDEGFLNELDRAIANASAVLFDASNGQMAIGNVNVYQNKENWLSSDVIIFASRGIRPMANIGGLVDRSINDIGLTGIITDAFAPGQVRMGPNWDPFGSNAADLGQDWQRAFAHELSHYLLYLPDNYIGIVNNSLAYIDCFGSLMTNTYDDDYSEFLRREEWDASADCQRTVAQLETGRTDWDTISAFYPELQNTDSTNTLNAGPATLPLDIMRMAIDKQNTAATTLPNRTYDLRAAEGSNVLLAAPRAEGYLHKTNGTPAVYTDDTIIQLGAAGGGGDRLIVRGADIGDRVCAVDIESARVGCTDITESSTSIFMSVEADWQPDIEVTAVNSVTLDIEVTLPVAVNGLDIQVIPAYGSAESPNVIAPKHVAMAGSGVVFNQQITLDHPSFEGIIRVWTPNAASTQESVSQYTLNSEYWGGNQRAWGGNQRAWGGNQRAWGGNQRAWGAPTTSGDGQVSVFDAANPFEVNGISTLQSLAVLPELPVWLTAVGSGYRVVEEAGYASSVAAIGNNRVISFNYLQSQVPDGYEFSLKVYFSADNGQTWQRLDTILDEDQNLATARLNDPADGIYTLLSTVDVPMFHVGWNNFGYPIPRTRAITEALAAVDGFYTDVYHYDAANGGQWTMHDVAVDDEHPAFRNIVNDLHDVSFSGAYWINITQEITLHLGVPSQIGRTVERASSAQLPPTTYFGWISNTGGLNLTIDLTVEAKVNGILCGQTTAFAKDGGVAYKLQVESEVLFGVPNDCGTDGANVQFYVDGIYLNGTDHTWDNTKAWYHELVYGAPTSAVQVQQFTASSSAEIIQLVFALLTLLSCAVFVTHKRTIILSNYLNLAQISDSSITSEKTSKSTDESRS
ncbi:MAG: FG-GAP-like repeat-containing protein, partial [Candidatus Promineifilaceae bacterium]